MSTALRTSLIWHDEVMGDVVHEKPARVTLGADSSSTFTTPDLALPPTFSIITAQLWTGPFLLLALAAFVLAANIRRRRADAAALPLSEAELMRARALLAGARR